MPLVELRAAPQPFQRWTWILSRLLLERLEGALERRRRQADRKTIEQEERKWKRAVNTLIR